MQSERKLNQSQSTAQNHQQDIHQTSKVQFKIDESIEVFTMTPILKFNQLPIYEIGSVINSGKQFVINQLHNDIFSYLESFINKARGYCYQKIFIKRGYIYVLKRVKHLYIVSQIWQTSSILKIYADKQYSKIRLVSSKSKDNIMIQQFFPRDIKQVLDELIPNLVQIGKKII